MLKYIKVKCPECGNPYVSGWRNEHDMQFVIRCEACGHLEKVFDMKFVEAFPDWFEVEDLYKYRKESND